MAAPELIPTEDIENTEGEGGLTFSSSNNPRITRISIALCPIDLVLDDVLC